MTKYPIADVPRCKVSKNKILSTITHMWDELWIYENWLLLSLFIFPTSLHKWRFDKELMVCRDNYAEVFTTSRITYVKQNILHLHSTIFPCCRHYTRPSRVGEDMGRSSDRTTATVLQFISLWGINKVQFFIPCNTNSQTFSIFLFEKLESNWRC
jgi:hypothetical protein